MAAPLRRSCTAWFAETRVHSLGIPVEGEQGQLVFCTRNDLPLLVKGNVGSKRRYYENVRSDDLEIKLPIRLLEFQKQQVKRVGTVITAANLRRNVYIFFSSSGEEMASELKARHLCGWQHVRIPSAWRCFSLDGRQLDQRSLLHSCTMGFVSVQIGWQSCSGWCCSWCQQWEWSTARVLCHWHSSTRWIHCVYFMLIADTNQTEMGQVPISLTTDNPRTRQYSVNYTYTPHVRLIYSTIKTCWRLSI